ncbi:MULTISPECIES: hypothetical protein [Pseudomonas]|uniref:hypothetical protein n=1 Tax=Pseudomonas guariconensis TaxID=1288410 RepID=UPI002096CEFF|nr:MULTISPECIES: hypothetical protein [Pseudomonas]MCO7595006.1 hypothetical protein [Pseudomonas guariconensis]MCU7221115.1 hypothetical protein [Pseudomonas brassicacearum]
MLKTVTADPMPGIGLAYIKGDAPVAKAGQTYPVWTNSHGAVTAVMEDGTRLGLRPAEFEVDSWHHLAPEPAPQHPEPIAWMVGTAIWWTKEEAERDAAATGLPIVGLGPMTGIATAETCQGEPVGEVVAFGKGLHEIAWASGRMPGLGAKLYTHADPGEVERLREGISKHWKVVCDQRAELETLRAQLAEQDSLLREVLEAFKLETDGSCINPGRDFIRTWAAKLAALSASAEPSAPNDCAICRDLGNQCMECEEGEFREWADRHFAAADYRKTDAGVFIQDWMRHAYGAWCARGALVRQS